MKNAPKKRRRNPLVVSPAHQVLMRQGGMIQFSRSRVGVEEAIIYGAATFSKSDVWVERDNFYGTSSSSDFILIGFDTEFKTPSDPVSRDQIETGFAKYEVLSYQVYVKAYRNGLPQAPEWGGICYPEPGQRLSLGALITFAIQGSISAKVIEKAPLNVYLVGHFTRADVPAFSDFTNVIAMADAIRGSFVTVGQSIALDYAFGDGSAPVALNVHLRDTSLLAATQSKSLSALGEVVGEPKVVLDADPMKEKFWKRNMNELLAQQPDLFERYAMTDAKICVRYMDQLLAQVREQTGETTPPLTLTSIGVDLLMSTWEASGLVADEVLGMTRVRERKYDKLRGFYVSEWKNVPIEPVYFHVDLATEAYHGGRNEQFWCGPCFEDDWTDWDLSSAYPTAMSLIRMPDWNSIRTTTDLADFTPETLGVANVEFSFPEGTRAPCLPVRTPNGLIFPMRGVSNCASPEIFLAVSMGATVRVRHGVVVPWLNDTPVFGDFIKACVAKRKSYPPGSFPNLMWKELTNATYGKTAQGLRTKRVYNLQARGTKPLPPSKITNPFFAAYITSYVRALLAEIMAALPATVCIFSCTTDGFLSNATDQEMELAACGPLSTLFRKARGAITGTSEVLERKHACRQLLGWKTRGQATLKPGLNPGGGDFNYVLAKGGIHVPEGYEDIDDRNDWIVDLYLNRTPESRIRMDVLTGIRDIVEYGADLVAKDVSKRLNMEFDWKRQPFSVRMATEPSHVAFSTVPWGSVEEFERVREQWEKHGTCMKTVEQFEAFACHVLARTTLGSNAAWMKTDQPDLKRLRQCLGSAWRNSKAGLVWREHGLSAQGFADILVEAGVPCRRHDVENDGKKPFEPHRCPATPDVEAALSRLMKGFPALDRNAFVSDRRSGIDLVSAITHVCPFTARL